MSVPAATIVLSFSQDPIDELFAANNPTNAAAVLSDLTKGNDALVFNNQSNPNFISMTHSFANANEGWKVELKLIDPGNEFERRWFTSNVMALTSASLHPPGGTPPENLTDPEVVGDENAEAVVKAYQEAFGLRYVFLAYGVGTNINTWAGPVKMTLASANISGKGAKEVTLTFVPTLGTITINSRKGAYNEMAKLNLQGLKERVSGTSEFFQFKDGLVNPIYTPCGFEKITDKSQIEELDRNISQDLKDSRLVNVSRLIEKVDIHSIVVDVIRRYIQNASGSANVIVLLPNINWICRYALDVIFKESSLRTPLISTESAIYEIYYETLFRIFSSFNLDFTSNIDGMLEYGYGSNLTYAAPQSSVSEFQRAMAVPPSFGSPFEPYIEPIDAAAAGLGNESVDVPPPSPSPSPAPVQGPSSPPRNYLEERDQFYENKRLRVKKIAVREEAQVIDHGEVLSEIISAIMAQSMSNYRIMGPVVLYEGDTDLLDIWKEQSEKSPLFFGKDSMAEINGSPNPVIIFGDASLIKRFLYAREDLTKTKEDIRDFRATAGDAQANFYSDTYQGENVSDVQQHQEGLTKVIEESLSLARNHAPLHPIDASILMNQKYNQSVKDVLYKSGNVVGSFGSISNLPRDFSDELADELAAEGSEVTPDYLTEKGIPVFRYNYENPNITNIDFNFGPQYFIELQKGFTKNINNLASTTVGGVFVDKYRYLPLQSYFAGLAYIRQRIISETDPFELDTLKDDLELLYTGADFETEQSPAQIAEVMIKIYKFMRDEATYKPEILIDQFLPGRPDSILADMTRQMYTRALQLNIKTLPTFHLSNTGVGLQFPALVLAQDAPIIGSDLSTRSPLNRIWSGLWSIFGWSHTISTRNVESSFRLVKTSMNTTQEGTDTDSFDTSDEALSVLAEQITLSTEPGEGNG